MMRHRSTGPSNNEDLRKKIVLSDLLRVLALAVPHRGLLICAAAFGVLGSVFQLVIPLLMKMAVDRVTHSNKVSDIDLFAAALTGFVLLSAGSNYAQFILSARA